MNYYTTFDVSRILKIDRTRLQEWIDRRYIIPDTPAAGRGTKALFTTDQLYRVKLAIWLMKAGKHRKAAFDLANIAWENVGPSPEKIRYMTLNHMVVSGNLMEAGNEKVTPNYPSQAMGENDVFRTAINLVAVMREVDMAIKHDSN